MTAALEREHSGAADRWLSNATILDRISGFVGAVDHEVSARGCCEPAAIGR